MMRSWLWVLLSLVLLLPAAGMAASPEQDKVLHPGADLWKEVRGRTVAPATTQVQGQDTGVLINKWGEQFRDYRRERFLRYAGYLLAGVVVLLAAFHLLHGAIKVEKSGRKIQRFQLYDRVAHWLLASVFLFLALTGLILAFGRFVILPWLGADAFSVAASASKEAHNLFGPLFIVALTWVFLRFVARNVPKWVDIVWLFKGGGMFGRSHVSAGFFNGGEKIWFWLLVLGGLLISVSGLALDFPSLLPSRNILVLSLVLHGAGAILLLAVSFGHIYMALGVQGTLDGMKSGMVDEEWARTHHDRWLAQVGASGQPRGTSGVDS
jgi:formate dehydrogenase subunit gamma